MRVNVVKSASHNLRVFSSVKSMLINSNTVSSLNICNAVKSVSLAHQVRRVFPVTHVISNRRQAFYPKTNVLSFSRTKSAPSYSTSNPSVSPLVISHFRNTVA